MNLDFQDLRRSIDLSALHFPVYLLEWDGATKLHTRDTLRAECGETNLFDPAEWGTWTRLHGSLDSVLDFMDTEPGDRSIWQCDNCTIQRIR